MTDFSKEINNFILELENKNDSKLFPYLLNKSWKPGEQIFYSGPYWDNTEVVSAMNALLGGQWLSAGENVEEFERKYSKKFKFSDSLMVNSGSSANLTMIASLKEYYGWHDEDEIIVSSCGFPTTLNPIIQNNLKPKLVDISFTDLNWNTEDIVNSITPKTKAIFSSPVLGNPGDFQKIIDIANSYNLQLISDNCDSLGSKWNGKFLTEYSVASSCSFYPAHHLCTIEGGMVSSNIKSIIDIARSIAWWGRACYCKGSQNKLPNGACGKRFDYWMDGIDTIVDHKYVFSQKGYNFKPADLQGAIGIVQLKKFDKIHAKRRENKQKIDGIFSKIPGCRVIKEHSSAEVSWFGVPLIYKGKHKLVNFLENNKIQTRNYFAGNLLRHPAYKNLDIYGNNKFNNADRVLDEVFFLGCSPVIKENMNEYIDEKVDEFIKLHT